MSEPGYAPVGRARDSMPALAGATPPPSALPAGQAPTARRPGRLVGLRNGWRSLNLTALIGLAGSTLALLVSLPSLTGVGGVGLFVQDVLAHTWVLVLLTLAAGSVRTMRFPAFAAVGFAGFFGMFGLAALVGRPLMSVLEQPQVGSVVVMPVIEEVLKVVPALIVVLLARRRAVRPSATDIMLLGAWSGAGFALHENALFGRGGFNFESPPVLTVLFPVMGTNWADGVTVIGAGHLLWSALIALGLGIGLLYRGGRWNWIAIPVTIAVALGEHAVANAFADGSVSVLVRVLHVLLLGGGLSTLLLVAGTAFVAYTEWTMTSHRQMTKLVNALGRSLPPLPPARVPRWVWVTPLESELRGRLLANWQTIPRRPAAPTPVGGTSAALRHEEGQR